MANKQVLTGDDTLKINGDIIEDLADGESVVISFPNELFTMEKGKNGNAIYAKNESGSITDMTARVLLGSNNDKTLNSLLLSQKQDFIGSSFIDVEFIKRLGDGAGNVSSVNYFLEGGMFKKEVDTKSSASGDVEQAVAVYTLQFARVKRILS
ncbi:hypothetical protein EOM39_01330 [Candidatus Gracilibacteria bacterium]|nr:hypothetical protein [Candidatus Gracilibacteria bacterium]